MGNSKKVKYVLIILFACSLWFIAGYYIENSFRKDVLSKKKMYCYEQYHNNVVNPVLYVEKKTDVDSLISFYQKIETGNMNPVFNFPINEMPYDTCVYVMGYELDSLIVDVVCYYDWGKTGSYRRGYVYRNTLHLNPPPKDRILKK